MPSIVDLISYKNYWNKKFTGSQSITLKEVGVNICILQVNKLAQTIAT